MERPWGGRRFETVLNIPLPSTGLIGELWAVVDRPEAESIVDAGPLQGKKLHELWTLYRKEVFGTLHIKNPSPSFPLLCKLLDAAEPLSLQVHPPATQAALLGGEPKTECWYVLHADPGATIDVGLRHGVTREQFSEAIKKGTVESMVHHLSVHTGESMFIPSGRLHALGKGIIVVEIQQNSDTTYRVFDWNRKNSNGTARQLHISESMASIDFSDDEPAIQDTATLTPADCSYFRIKKWNLKTPRQAAEPNNFSLMTCLTGRITCGDRTFGPGSFFLIPANMPHALLFPEQPGTSVLQTQLVLSA